MAEADDTVPWVETLHSEFLRFFDGVLSTIPGEENQNTLRDSVLALIGWLPTDTPAARQRHLEELCDDAEALVRESGDPSTPEARELLKSADEARRMTRQAEGKYRAWRQDVVDALNKSQ